MKRLMLRQMAWLQIGIALAGASAAAEDDPCSGNLVTTQAQSQRQQYCDAAKAADKAAKANKLVGGVYAGVAAVCTTACAMSYWPTTSITYSRVCTGVSLAGAATDFVVTKNFAGAMMQLASIGGGMMINGGLSMGGGAAQQAAASAKSAQAASKAASEAATQAASKATGNATEMAASEAAKKTAETAGQKASEVAAKNAGGSMSNMDVMSCLSAAMAMFQTFQNFDSASKNKSVAKQNRDAARQVLDPNAPANPASLASVDSGDASAARVASNSVSGKTGTSESTSAAESSACGSGTSAGAVIACATAMDSNLPAFVKSPEFIKELEETTGQKAGEFLNQDSPASALAGMGGAFSPEGQKKMEALVASARSQMLDGGPDSVTYAGGGGAAKSGGTDPSLDQMMAGLLNQFAPKAGEEKMPVGVKEMAFNKIGRAPAAAAEDPTISLFDRVAYRYRSSLDKVDRLNWALPSNQMLAGTHKN